ncbi:MAG: DNA-3-methyladenine glycosylase, partial [Acidimicrobiia bacterium]|nr:DNA-3-methyladenine glycosylase [Acidimicrobiia bacterium]
QALGVTGEMNGSKVNLGVIELVDRDHEPADVVATPRIGISKAVDRPWRFVVRG